MKIIGKEFVRNELVYVPARMFVRKIYIETTRCISCGIDESRDNENDKDIPRQVFGKATAPAALISGSFCSPELLAIQSMYRLCRFTVRKRIMQPAV